jgi:hypothetical protein
VSSWFPAFTVLLVAAVGSTQAQTEQFAVTAKRLGLAPIRTSNHRWEVRIWTTGYLDLSSGLSSLVRFWPDRGGVRGTYLTYWQQGTGREVDSLWRAEGKRTTWRDETIRLLECRRVQRRLDLEWCERLVPSDTTWGAVLRIFEANDGWNLVDESAAPRLETFTLDGNGWFVELVRAGHYRAYGYQNPPWAGPGPWGQAARLERGIFCQLDPRFNMCQE